MAHVVPPIRFRVMVTLMLMACSRSAVVKADFVVIHQSIAVVAASPDLELVTRRQPFRRPPTVPAVPQGPETTLVLDGSRAHVVVDPDSVAIPRFTVAVAARTASEPVQTLLSPHPAVTQPLELLLVRPPLGLILVRRPQGLLVYVHSLFCVPMLYAPLWLLVYLRFSVRPIVSMAALRPRPFYGVQWGLVQGSLVAQHSNCEDIAKFIGAAGLDYLDHPSLLRELHPTATPLNPSPNPLFKYPLSQLGHRAFLSCITG
jgi:hypothetical protein